MSNIRDLIEEKNQVEEKFKTVLVEFLYKYMSKIYKSLPDKRLKTFQKTLLYIPDWDHTKQNKVYNKFLEYLKTKDVSESEFESLLENIISLNIKIILIFSEKYKNEFVTIPNPNDFLYRCIRYTAKAYYDCPSQIDESTSSQKLMLKEIVDWNVQKYIPLKKIFDYQQQESESEFDSDSQESTKSSESEEIEKNISNLKIEKEDIKYLSENEFNEYYMSDSDENKIDNIKHITIKKKSKKF
jgi:hypothetical protein